MINKLMLAFCIIAWVVVIPYLMHDINESLDHCQQLTDEINGR